jgi:aconitate hydratase
MGMNITEKILSEHLVEGNLKPGNEIAITIDHAITQDATGTMVYLQFESMGLKKIKSELCVSYVDHNTVQVGPENADDHDYLQTAAAKYGAIYSKPGNGICHQLHLERYGAPGKTMLGSDSHTPTGGGLGMIAIGAGGIDVAVAMGGGCFYLTAPKVIKIELKGKLRPWVSAKDLILKVLEKFTTKGNVGCVFEYAGPALQGLSVPERATITNMGAECGVTTSLFPSDDVTKSFLEAQGRGECWQELKADADADYFKTITIDLSEIETMAAKPHSPGNVATINSLLGMKVNQVMVGSCTNSSYRDLKMVAKILEGKKVHPDVELGIAPGSRQVMLMLAKEKLLEVFYLAGARILENACGFCIGNSMSPPSEGISLRTSNRNFEGRSGTKSAQVYLVSPEVATLAALNGRIVDPLTQTDEKCPSVRQPKEFLVDDSMFLAPAGKAAEIEIKRGPSIGSVPENEKLADKLDGVVTIKVGDKVTTDHIMPAGPRLKHRSNVQEYSKYVFEHVDPQFHDRAAEHRDSGIHNVIIAGDSYGQGSSREHAALCPMFLGVKAVVAKSIERIHLANLINFGIVPFSFVNGDDFEKLAEGDRLLIEGLKAAIEGDGKAVLKNQSKDIDIPVKVDLSERQKKIMLVGGLLPFTVQK